MLPVFYDPEKIFLSIWLGTICVSLSVKVIFLPLDEVLDEQEWT